VTIDDIVTNKFMFDSYFRDMHNPYRIFSKIFKIAANVIVVLKTLIYQHSVLHFVAEYKYLYE